VRGRALVFLALLVALPALAYLPCWGEGRLLGPGDGAALHFPLRSLVWEAYRGGELPAWNPTIFLGTPLLAAYRPGAFFPAMPLLALLPSFAAFQVLVLVSLAAAGALVFFYVRRLGAEPVGAYVAGLCFALGPYLVGHVDDTATLVAAPMLPLVLLAAEAHLRRGTHARAAGLAVSVAFLLLAGSPEAARAGLVLVSARLVLAHVSPAKPAPSWSSSLVAVAAGVLLAAPQLIPTFLAAGEAGRPVTGLATTAPTLPGAAGLILRYVSHTPAPALALAALPLALSRTPVRVLALALALVAGLQWGRGPLSAPGALPLVFDLTLSILAGLSMSAQWTARREAGGRRLRGWFLLASILSAAALSISAAALGPLPQSLAGAVGVLALALVLYFTLAASADPVVARVWLLPLTVSFVLQPHGRRVWEGAPKREELAQGTATRQAIDGAMGPRRAEPTLALVRAWPGAEAADLAYANLGAATGRRSANGYDPMVPLRTRAALGGMSVGGVLPGAFFRSDPARLGLLGIRWVELPASALAASADQAGFGEPLVVMPEPGRDRFFPVPIVRGSQVRVDSWMSESVAVPHAQAVARLVVRLASGREIPLVVRAGVETAEWAYDRPDVVGAIAHRKAPVIESFAAPGGFQGHHYLGVLPLPGRYLVDGIRVERLQGPGRFTVSRLAVVDPETGRSTPVSLAAGYVSDATRFREAAATPGVRLFESTATVGPGRVVERLRVLADDAAVLAALAAPTAFGIDPRREALATARDAAGVVLAASGRASRAQVVRSGASRLEVRAEGPGLLVVAQGFDPGWSASVDGRETGVVRVNHAQIGIPLPAGTHRVALRYRARGLLAGACLAAVAAGALALRGRFS
jgi:membrane protein YfhO